MTAKVVYPTLFLATECQGILFEIGDKSERMYHNPSKGETLSPTGAPSYGRSVNNTAFIRYYNRGHCRLSRAFFKG